MCDKLLRRESRQDHAIDDLCTAPLDLRGWMSCRLSSGGVEREELQEVLLEDASRARVRIEGRAL